jgi:hypothetical protein
MSLGFPLFDKPLPLFEKRWQRPAENSDTRGSRCMPKPLGYHEMGKRAPDRVSHASVPVSHHPDPNPV